ncbi:MAG: hypothetical protein ACQKBY_07480 [Verrucomicrobiales bacterium]
MHLRFSEEELATLIEMVSLAAEIANLNQSEGAEEHFSRFEAVENKVLESAKHAGFGSWIEFDEARGRHRVTEEFQERSFFQQSLEELRNQFFWEDLMIRLAERDLMREYGEARWEAMDEKRREALAKPLEKRYWDRFMQEGIGPLHWVHPRGEG